MASVRVISRPNQFSSVCESCKVRVNVGDGWIFRKGTAWRTTCRSGQCLERLGLAYEAPDRKVRADGSVVFPYDPNTSALVASAPGARFDKPNGCWWVSIAPEHRERLLEIAKAATLTVDPALLGPVGTSAAETASRDRAVAAGAYPYQVWGVEWISRRAVHGRAALVADDMGVGKTNQSLLAIPEGGRAIVVCKASLCRNWRRETQRWRPDLTPMLWDGTTKFEPNPGEVLIVSYDSLPEWLWRRTKLDAWNGFFALIALEAMYRTENNYDGGQNARSLFRSMTKANKLWKYLPDKKAGESHIPAGYDVSQAWLIVDEAHAVKSRDALRHKRIKELRQLSLFTLFLTGSPMTNEPPDLWGVLQCAGLESEAFGDFFRFMKLYDAVKTRYGIEWGEPTAKVPELLRRVMLRRLKSEVLPDLPSKTREYIEVDLEEGTTKKLDEAWDRFGTMIRQGDLPGIHEMASLRKALAISRIPAAIEIAEDYEDRGEPLVVFSAHVEPLRRLGDREGWARISGDVSLDKRDQAVQDFQAGKLKGLAIQIAAGGVGLTLTRSSHVLFVDLDWTPALNEQAEDRVCRIGQTANKIVITTLTSDHILDRHVLQLLQVKGTTIANSLDTRVEPKVEVKSVIEGENARLQAIIAEEKRKIRESIANNRQAALNKIGTFVGGHPDGGIPRTPARRVIEGALAYMLSVCDGALERDNHGFNKLDATRARWLDAVGLAEPIALRAAYLMLRGYPRQLKLQFPGLFDASSRDDNEGLACDPSDMVGSTYEGLDSAPEEGDDTMAKKEESFTPPQIAAMKLFANKKMGGSMTLEQRAKAKLDSRVIKKLYDTGCLEGKLDGDLDLTDAGYAAIGLERPAPEPEAVEGEEKAEKAPKAPRQKKEKQLNFCLCGCGGQTTRQFLQGHDMKLRSAVQKFAKTGEPTEFSLTDAQKDFINGAHWSSDAIRAVIAKL